MSETPNFGLSLMEASSSAKSIDYNEAVKIIDALLSGSVEDTAQTAPPGAPSDGDLWAVPAAATGDWAGQGGKLALFIGGGWVFKAPPASLIFTSVANGLTYASSGAEWVRKGSAFDVPFGWDGAPSGGKVMARRTFARKIELPVNFSGAVGSIDVLPTATFDIDVMVNAVLVGNVSISTAGVFSFSTVGAAKVVLLAGDRLTIKAPITADDTAADFDFTFKAES